MRSGLDNYTQSRALNRTMDTQPRHVFRPQDLLRIAYGARPHPVPGERFEYCNTNTILLGLIAEQLYGRPLAEIFEHHLFGPLGMSRSSMPGLRAGGSRVRIPAATCSGPTSRRSIPRRCPPPTRRRRGRPAQAARRHDRKPLLGGRGRRRDLDGRGPRDMGQGMCDGSLLNRRWQRRRLDSIRSVDPSNPHASGYGLALAKTSAVYGHGGWIPGFQTFAAYDPARRLTLVVWTNLKASPRGLPCAQTIAHQLLGGPYA